MLAAGVKHSPRVYLVCVDSFYNETATPIITRQTCQRPSLSPKPTPHTPDGPRVKPIIPPKQLSAHLKPHLFKLVPSLDDQITTKRRASSLAAIDSRRRLRLASHPLYHRRHPHHLSPRTTGCTRDHVLTNLPVPSAYRYFCSESIATSCI